jgi:hypothetical protein
MTLASGARLETDGSLWLLPLLWGANRPHRSALAILANHRWRALCETPGASGGSDRWRNVAPARESAPRFPQRRRAKLTHYTCAVYMTFTRTHDARWCNHQGLAGLGSESDCCIMYGSCRAVIGQRSADLEGRTALEIHYTATGRWM